MSLGQQMNAVEMSLERLLRELKIEVLTLSTQSERPNVDSPKFHELTGKLTNYQGRLERMNRELGRMEGNIRGRQQLVKHHHKGSAGRWGAQQSVNSHSGRKKQLTLLAAEVANKLAEAAHLGNTPGLGNVAKGIKKLGDHLSDIVDAARQEGETVISVDAQGLKDSLSAFGPQSQPVDLPMSFFTTTIFLILALMKKRNQRKAAGNRS
jgi:hypothetical protein